MHQQRFGILWYRRIRCPVAADAQRRRMLAGMRSGPDWPASRSSGKAYADAPLGSNVSVAPSWPQRTRPRKGSCLRRASNRLAQHGQHQDGATGMAVTSQRHLVPNTKSGAQQVGSIVRPTMRLAGWKPSPLWSA